MTYQDILQSEFEYRVEANPSYSLRSFARDLELTPSQLSDVLKNKKGLSVKKALIVAQNLGLNLDDSLLFKALVEVAHSKNPKIVKLAQEFIKANSYKNSFKLLHEDAFFVIKDWHHFAILSCMELDGFNGEIEFICKQLNLEESTVEAAIFRMVKLNMVNIIDGKLSCSGQMYQTTDDIESKALKESHKSNFKRMGEMLDEIAIELRDFSSMTMAIDAEKIPLAKEKIRSFRRELCQFLENDKKNEVYELNIQLVPARGFLR